MALTYVQQVGPPPDPRTFQFRDWYTRRINYLLEYCARSRAATYYVSHSSGADTNAGTLPAPWKTIAKAQSFITANPGGDYAILFKQGDEWNETAGLQSTAPNVTLGAYGGGAKPFFNCFSLKYTTGWISVSGNLWKRAESNAISWFRLTGPANPQTLAGVGWGSGLLGGTAGLPNTTELPANLYPLIPLTSSSAVGSNAGTWFYDSAGSDPNSSGVPTLYCNLGSPSAPPPCEAVINNSVYGLNIAADGCLVRGLRGDGFGRSGINGTGGVGVIMNTQVGNDGASVFYDCEAYYGGDHIFGQNIGVGAGAGFGVFAHCRGGFTVGYPSLSASTFIGFGEDGGHEIYLVNCESLAGNLPAAAAWPIVSTLTNNNNGQTFYSHTSGNVTPWLALALAVDFRQRFACNYPAAAGYWGVLPPAATLGQVRGFIIGQTNDAAADGAIFMPGVAPIEDNMPNNAWIGCRWFTNFSVPSGNFYGYPSAGIAGGWMINCQADFTCIGPGEANALAAATNSPAHNLRAWHSTIRLLGSWNPAQFYFWGSMSSSSQIEFTNCDFVHAANVPMTGWCQYSADVSVRSNCCYDTSWICAGDAAAIVATGPHIAGYVPDVLSELYRAAGPLPDGIAPEYDIDGNPRGTPDDVGPRSRRPGLSIRTAKLTGGAFGVAGNISGSQGIFTGVAT